MLARIFSTLPAVRIESLEFVTFFAFILYASVRFRVVHAEGVYVSVIDFESFFFVEMEDTQ